MAAILGRALQAHVVLVLDCAAVHVLLFCLTTSFYCDRLLLELLLTIPLLLCVEIDFALPVIRAFLARVHIELWAFIILLAFADLLPKIVKLEDFLLRHLHAGVSEVHDALLKVQCMFLCTACTWVLQ